MPIPDSPRWYQLHPFDHSDSRPKNSQPLSCEQLCDEKAAQLINDWVAARHDLDELRQKYVPEFGAVIPATKVLRLYQLEGLREAVVRVDRFKKVPLAK
jgi:hypothetical protein